MALPSINGPIVASFNVTPSNSTVFPLPTRAIYVGSGGNVSVHWAAANVSPFAEATYPSNQVFVSVSAGQILPIRVDMIYTDTTANNIIALF
jgi:hypothetical protein